MAKEHFNVIGKRHERIEAFEKVTGQMKYTGDLKFPGMLHMKILRSDVAHAHVKSIDTSAAKALPGVKAVITHEDVPKIPTMHQFLHLPNLIHYDSFLLEKTVRHYGDRIAAVAATSPEIAEEALSLIKVEYEMLPSVVEFTDAVKEEATKIHTLVQRGEKPHPVENNVTAKMTYDLGDVEKGFAEADKVFEHTFRTSKPNPAPMEKTAAVAIPGPKGKVEIYATTQSIHAMRKNIACSLGMPLQKLTCHWMYLGGSFGAHIHTGWIEPLVCFMATLTGKPIRGEKSREDMFLSCGRHPMELKLKTGVNKDGSLTAMHVDVIDDTGGYAFSGGSKMALASGFTLSMYKVPNMKITGRTVYTNTPPLTAMRGAGNPQANWAVESQMDIIADHFGFDPVEFRLKNHIGLGDTFFGQGIDVVCEIRSCATEELMREGAKRIGWETRNNHDTDKAWVKRGIGVARGFHTSGAGSPKPSKFILDYSGAIVKLDEDGTFVISNASAEAGGGNRSAYTLMAAEVLGVNAEDVTIHEGSTATTLFDVPTHASRGNYGTGLAVVKASENLKVQILEWGAKILEVTPDELSVGDCKVFVTTDPGKSVTMQVLAETAQNSGWGSAIGTASVRPEACPPHFIVTFIELAVDTRTGSVEVLNTFSGADAGTIINPNSVEGQIVGGMHMGLGYGLMEDTLFDKETGALLTPDFHDYKMLTMLDMPPVIKYIADTYEPTGPLGAKSIGEGVTNPVASAVGNAIANAIGVRVFDLPITPEKILNALKEKQL